MPKNNNFLTDEFFGKYAWFVTRTPITIMIHHAKQIFRVFVFNQFHPN